MSAPIRSEITCSIRVVDEECKFAWSSSRTEYPDGKSSYFRDLGTVVAEALMGGNDHWAGFMALAEAIDLWPEIAYESSWLKRDEQLDAAVDDFIEAARRLLCVRQQRQSKPLAAKPAP